MSKKTNTLLFILGATVVNILTTILCFIILFAIFASFIVPVFIGPQADPESEIVSTTYTWGLLICFIGAIVLSFVLYRLVLKLIMKKIDFDKHFDPIFGRRRK